MAESHRLADSFIHLGLSATAVPQPRFDGLEWYEAYGARHGGDGAEGRLVSQHSFSENWNAWEMHPHGAEVVICIEGGLVLTQDFRTEGPSESPFARATMRSIRRACGTPPMSTGRRRRSSSPRAKGPRTGRGERFRPVAFGWVRHTIQFDTNIGLRGIILRHWPPSR